MPWVAGANQVIRIWAANSTSSGPVTQLSGCSVTAGNIVSLDFTGFTELEFLWLYAGCGNALDLSAAFTSTGRAYLKTLGIDGGNLAAEVDVSAFTGLKKLAIYDGPFITSIITAPVGLENIPSNFFSGYSTLYGCGLETADLDAFFTGLSPVPNSGRIQIANNPGTNDCDVTIAENKGYEVFLTAQEEADFVNAENGF